MKLFIVDAFTTQLFGGNPAGVVIVEQGMSFPSDETMKKLAAELRYSESAFVKQLSPNSFQTRYFTPEAEVDLCGHATIATFHVLRKLGLVQSNQQYFNQTLAGNLRIILKGESIYMEMGTPTAMGTMRDPQAIRELYQVLGIPAVANQVGDKLLPEIISTGLPDIIVTVPTEADLAAIKPDFPALSKLSEKYKVVGVHAFTVGKDGKFHVRNFAPLYGIDEEAATGTANGALTYYLYQHGLIADEAETEFIQGEAMNRPSSVSSVISKQGSSVQIFIGGQAVILVEGTVYLKR